MPDDGVLAAFTSARETAEKHMAASDADDATWHEETVTDLVLRAARARLAYHAFNRRQEAHVGADWLWWWVEAGGECFGMLVQAKRLHRRGERLEVDLRADHGAQMARLLGAADLLGVPAMYALYLGTAAWRAPVTCGTAPHPPGCLRCRRATLSVLTGLQAQLCSASPRDAATAALTSAVPLEDLADPACGADPVYDVNLDHLDGPLRAFLLQQQTGARAVARTVMAMLAAERRGQFSLAAPEREQLDLDAVFTDLPDDTGHYHQPYFPHVLRGLRTGPPDYLDAAVAGHPPPHLAAHADGIVVVTL